MAEQRSGSDNAPLPPSARMQKREQRHACHMVFVTVLVSRNISMFSPNTFRLTGELNVQNIAGMKRYLLNDISINIIFST